MFSPATAGHWHGLQFVGYGLHAFTFLRPFAPRALPRFLTTMDALTPDRRALRTLTSGNEHPPFPGQVSLVHLAQPSMHSVSNHLTRPITASLLPTQRNGLPGTRPCGSPLSDSWSGLRTSLESSSQHPAESSSSSYGLHVRLRLLPTPPHDEAVTLGYQERASPGRGLAPLRSCLLPGALGARHDAPIIRRMRYAPNKTMF